METWAASADDDDLLRDGHVAELEIDLLGRSPNLTPSFPLDRLNPGMWATTT